MRSFDVGSLAPLGPEASGPWRVGEGELLRVRSGNRVIPTEEQAREMLEVYRAAAAAAGTPDGYEVVRVEGCYGVLVEYVAGVPIGTHLAIGSYSPREVGEEMARLLHGLHAQGMGVGRDYDSVFRTWARELAPLLPEALGGMLVELVEAIPRRHTLVHGDAHVGNVVVRGGRPTLVDLESAGYGHPVFDLAVACSRMRHNVPGEAERIGVDGGLASRVSTEVWQSLLASYFDGAGTSGVELLGRRIDVLAEVESCCFGYGIRSCGEALGERQQARLAECAERLSGLLPRLDRLDFGETCEGAMA